MKDEIRRIRRKQCEGFVLAGLIILFVFRANLLEQHIWSNIMCALAAVVFMTILDLETDAKMELSEDHRSLRQMAEHIRHIEWQLTTSLEQIARLKAEAAQ